MIDKSALEERDEISEQRLDLVLYNLRFFKTRALAQERIGKGRIRVNGEKTTKPSKKIRRADQITFMQNQSLKAIRITDFQPKRVSAPLAQNCYEEIALA